MGLSLTETRKTLEFVHNIKKAGKSAIFIDHNIFHVYPVVDRLYVLDRGKVAGRLRQARDLHGRTDRPALPRRALRLAGVGTRHERSCHRQARQTTGSPRRRCLRRHGSQLGIIGVGLAMWLSFVIAAPTVFTNVNIYAAFAQTTPQFGIIALALTFVVITGEIDLCFPSIMALGTAAFCLLVTAELAANGARPRRRLRHRRALRPGQRRSWSPSSTSPRWSSPSAPRSCSAGSSWC